MKRCTKCNIEKELSEFRFYYRKAEDRSYYRQPCKDCEKISARGRALRWAKNNLKRARDKSMKYYYNTLKDGYYYVYLLPNENYVGQTSTIKKRIREHLNDHNRDTTDWKVLHKCTTREEALSLERSYHEKGYKG